MTTLRQTPDTLQSVLADFFRHQASHHRHEYRKSLEREHEDLRRKCSADWLCKLAWFVQRLPEYDSRLKTLADFGWPAECFRRGTGTEGLHAALSIGFKGGIARPIVREATTEDLEEAWKDWVIAARRDAYAVERVIEIVGAILEDAMANEDVPTSRVQTVLDKLRIRSLVDVN
jgi:hypothetical protein